MIETYENQTVLLNGILHSVAMGKEEIVQHYTTPHVTMRPSLSLDGNQWCALYGASIQDGVAGFGGTPHEAMVAFDAAWFSERGLSKGGE